MVVQVYSILGMVDTANPWQPPLLTRSFQAWNEESIESLREPAFGSPHLTLFMVVSGAFFLEWYQVPQPALQPTELCDAGHPDVVACARKLVPEGASGRASADAIRRFVRNEIAYVLGPKDAKASDVLASREGMCTNKAMLQVALCRAVGLPAGFIITHITKAVYAAEEGFDPELLARIHEPTIHVFAAVWVPEEGAFRLYDATEGEVEGAPFTSPAHPAPPRLPPTPGPGVHETCDAQADDHGGALVGMVELPGSGETRYAGRWLAGPFSPVQASLDSLLKRVPYRAGKGAAVARQNAKGRGEVAATDKAPTAAGRLQAWCVVALPVVVGCLWGALVG